jgi:hypothetical protein
LESLDSWIDSIFTNLKPKVMIKKYLKSLSKNENSNLLILGIVSITLINVLIFGFSHSTKLVTIQEQSEEINNIIIKDEVVFSEDNLKNLLLELNVRFPHIVLAQARLESGNFKSHMFLENNNIFGMKEAKRRPTTNKGTQNGHAYYENWKDCVIDYAFYQAAYLNSLKTEDQYYQYLSASYAEDPKYISKVRSIANTIKANN